jgi:hypothetical protein
VSKTPQQEGRDWEPAFAASIGAKPVTMSGAGFHKLDVRGSSILWSLKWAGNHESVRIQDAWMHEALRAIHSPGGVGGHFIPAIATKTAGYELMTFRKDDALMLMTSDDHSVATPASYGVVDLGRRVPAFLRPQED